MQSFTATANETCKTLASMYIGFRAAKAAENALINHTNLDEDGFPVNAAGFVAGSAASFATGPAVNKSVDVVFDKITAYRANRKKTPTE